MASLRDLSVYRTAFFSALLLLRACTHALHSGTRGYRLAQAMHITTRVGVAAKERDVAVKWIKRCLREITRKEHELPVDYATARSDITVTLKHAGHRSSACAKGVNIDLTAYLRQSSALSEYPAFAHDRVIGSRANLTPELVLAATIAHEISHFVQYRYGPDTRWLMNRYRKPHGEGFQDIYRILRSQVVNPYFTH